MATRCSTCGEVATHTAIDLTPVYSSDSKPVYGWLDPVRFDKSEPRHGCLEHKEIAKVLEPIWIESQL